MQMFWSAKKICILVMGDSGLGKSTLINLFSTETAAASFGASSQTTQCTIYGDSGVGSRTWMDTRGWNDSSGVADEDTFREIMHTLFENQIEHVQVVWMVPSTIRMTDSLQSQAKFMAAMGEYSDNRSDVWQSVLIVCNRGDLDPFDNDKKGAIAAAIEHGAPDPQILACGYTALDHLEGREKTKKENQAGRMEEAERREEGLLYDPEIQQHVDDQLRNLSTVQIKFFEKKCQKCGIIGDERCIPRGCHTAAKFIHPQQNKFVHMNELKENQIRQCGRGHRTSKVLDASSAGKTWPCSLCRKNYDRLYYCETCNKYYCGDESSVDKFEMVVVGVAMVVAGVVAGGVAGVALLAEELVAASALAGGSVGASALAGAASGNGRCTHFVDGYPCCRTLEGSEGCSYACCRTKVRRDGGCTKVCNKCGLAWGTRGHRACDVNSQHAMEIEE